MSSQDTAFTSSSSSSDLDPVLSFSSSSSTSPSPTSSPHSYRTRSRAKGASVHPATTTSAKQSTQKSQSKSKSTNRGGCRPGAGRPSLQAERARKRAHLEKAALLRRKKAKEAKLLEESETKVDSEPSEDAEAEAEAEAEPSLPSKRKRPQHIVPPSLLPKPPRTSSNSTKSGAKNTDCLIVEENTENEENKQNEESKEDKESQESQDRKENKDNNVKDSRQNSESESEAKARAHKKVEECLRHAKELQSLVQQDHEEDQLTYDVSHLLLRVYASVQQDNPRWPRARIIERVSVYTGYSVQALTRLIEVVDRTAIIPDVLDLR